MTIIKVIDLNVKNNKEEFLEISEIKVGDKNVLYFDLTNNTNNLSKVLEKNADIEKKAVENAQNQYDLINEKYFNVEINLDNKTIVADEKQIPVSDLLGEDTGEQNSKEKLIENLQENLTGDVKFNDNTIKIENPYSTKTLVIETENLKEVESYGNVEAITKVSDDIYCIKYESAKDTKKGYEILQEEKNVKSVCKDEIVSLLENDNIDEMNSLSVSNGNYAWPIITTGLYYYKSKLDLADNLNTIRVAVLDTGIYAKHEAFKNEIQSDRLDMQYAYNYVNNNNDVTDVSVYSHGTKVAGLIAQSTSNNVKIVPIKVLESETGLFSNVITGFADIQNKVDILNLSIGVDNMSDIGKSMFEEIFENTYENGKIIICASGNDGMEKVYYPAASNFTIGVSSIGIYNELSEVTGLAEYSNYGNEIDFSAPGSGMKLPKNTGIADYDWTSGTSFSAPLITSAVAMLKTENLSLTTQSAINMLKTYCTDLGANGKDKYFGYGALDIGNKMFGKPIIASVETTSSGNHQKTIKTTAICYNRIIKYGYSNSSSIEPQEWRNTDGNIVEQTETFPENEDKYVWFRDEKGNTSNKLILTKEAEQITSNYFFVDNNNKIITGINAGTTVQQLKNKINSLYGYQVKNLQGNIATDSSLVGTNYKISTILGDYTLIVTGDLNGNGKIDINDIAQTQKIALKLVQKDTYKEKAADINQNKKIDINDLARLQKMLLKIK